MISIGEKNTTGSEIARLRRKKGLTQIQLAQLVGVTDRAVSRWETGAGMPDAAVLTALADALSTTVDALLALPEMKASQADAPTQASAGTRTKPSASMPPRTGSKDISFVPAPEAALADSIPLATMTGLRTKQALNAIALSTASTAVRMVSSGGAVLCCGCGVLSLFFTEGTQRLIVLFSFFIAACLCFVNAIGCILRKKLLRAACRGDFAPVTIAVHVQECIWQRGAATQHIRHTQLHSIRQVRGGFLLIWGKRTVSFVEGIDAPAVAALSQAAHQPVQAAKKSRTAVLLAATLVGCVLSVSFGLLLGFDLACFREYHSYSALPVQPQQDDNGTTAPFFPSGAKTQYTFTDDKVWFTVDGGESFFCPTLSVPENDFFASAPPITAYAGNNFLCAVYESDGVCAAMVSTDKGQNWHIQSFGDLALPVGWNKLFFVTEQRGFLALGTPWSMGGGEAKAAYVTEDGGVTWVMLPKLPLQNSRYILCGFALSPAGTAALSLKTPEEENVPLVYLLAKGEQAWRKVTLPGDLPLPYVHAVQGLAENEKGFFLTLTQEPYATGTMTLFSETPDGPWQTVS